MMRSFSILICLFCGLSLSAESFSFTGINHLAGEFDGLDRWGNIFITEKIGQVGAVPMYAYWSSGNVTNSQPAVNGWKVPLLESRIVPLTESTYELIQPDGVSRTLWIDPKKPSELYSNGWKGSIHSSDIVLTSRFSYQGENLQLSFHQGRLIRMRIAEGTFDFAYNGRTLEKIVSDGKTLLAVSRDPKNASRRIFRFADKKTAAMTRYDYRMEIEAVDGKLKRFDYGTDGENGTMKSADGSFCWNRYTGTAVSANDWSFKVGKRQPSWNDPPISRKHKDGRVESYWFDMANGKGKSTEADGTCYEWAKFPTGDLYGLTRWSEVSRKGKLLARNEFSYDSSRRLIFKRRTAYDPETSTDETWFGPDGKATRRRHNGKEVKP